MLIQPMAADDVAAAVCKVTLAAPLNNTIEIAGPEPLRFEDFVRQGLRSVGEQRVVIACPQARYFGARLSERTLLPGNGAELGTTRFIDWLKQYTAAKSATAQVPTFTRPEPSL